jgi:hypothetical protein
LVFGSSNWSKGFFPLGFGVFVLLGERAQSGTNPTSSSVSSRGFASEFVSIESSGGGTNGVLEVCE